MTYINYVFSVLTLVQTIFHFNRKIIHGLCNYFVLLFTVPLLKCFFVYTSIHWLKPLYTCTGMLISASECQTSAHLYHLQYLSMGLNRYTYICLCYQFISSTLMTMGIFLADQLKQCYFKTCMSLFKK